MNAVLAQFGTVGSIGQFVITLMIIAGVIGVGLAFLTWRKVTIPEPIVTIFWIVVAVFVGVWAVRLLVGM